MRHAKSDWSLDDTPDIDRPLNSRGQGAALRMGQWLTDEQIQPSHIICSNARRARETLDGVLQSVQIDDAAVHFDPRAYLANLYTLLSILADAPEQSPILLIAHNPGLEELLTYLCGPDLPYNAKGHLLSSGTLAQIQLPDDWHELERQCGQLQQLIRPRELPPKQ